MRRWHRPVRGWTLAGAPRRWLIGALGAALLLAPVAASAQPGSATDWQATGVPGPVLQLFLADGALLVETADFALLRSDDGGTTFQPVPLPPGARVQEVDPTNPDVVYAAGPDGLVKSADGGAAYEPLLSGAIVGVSVSPVTPDLVYVAAGGPTPSRMLFFRSREGGASFAPLGELASQSPGCVFGLGVLKADASDPGRVFRAASCLAGRDLASPSVTRALERSLDQGETWMDVARPQGGRAERLVGGRGSQPARYYLADFKPFFGRPAVLYRSDDGAASFAPVFQLPSVEGAEASGGGQPAIGGLAYDPARPDRVFLGQRHGATGVLVSDDGGRTFVQLGRPDLGEVLDLALSPDGRTLYVATSAGLFRLALQPGGPLPTPGLPPRQVPGGSK